jgi:hypothetical protein
MSCRRHLTAIEFNSLIIQFFIPPAPAKPLGMEIALLRIETCMQRFFKSLHPNFLKPMRLRTPETLEPADRKQRLSRFAGYGRASTNSVEKR